MTTDLKKLFVLVKTGTEGFDGAIESAKTNKIYFEQDKNTIWHQGVQYGMTPEQVKDLEDVIALVGERPDDWAENIDTVIGHILDAEGRLDAFDASAAIWDEALQEVNAEGDDYIDASFGAKTDNEQVLQVSLKEDAIVKGTGDHAEDVSLATQGYVDDEVAKAVKGGVQYKGTTSVLPDTAENGDMYKVVYAEGAEAIVIDGKEAKNGDVIIFHQEGEEAGEWQLIPAGDDVEYTGIKVAGKEGFIIDPTVGGDVEFAGDDDLINVDGSIGHVQYKASDRLNTAIEDAEADHELIHKDEDGILARLDDAEVRLDEHDAHLDDLDSSVDNLRDYIGEIPAESEAETVIAYVDEQVANANADLLDLSTYVHGTVDASVNKNTEDIAALDASVKAAFDALDVAETTVGEGNVRVTYSEEDGIVEISDVSVDEAEVEFIEATEEASANLIVKTGDEAKLLNAGSIDEIKSYVDAVAAANQEGITVLVSEDGGKAVVDASIAEVDKDDDHKVTLKTGKLGAVGLVKDEETGKWVPGEVGEDVSGLALASDVATELASDESVIADALNDHEDRITAIEEWDPWEVYGEDQEEDKE